MKNLHLLCHSAHWCVCLQFVNVSVNVCKVHAYAAIDAPCLVYVLCVTNGLCLEYIVREVN